MRLNLAIGAVSLALLAASADAGPLSRPEAMRAIEKHPDFAVVTSIPNATHPSFDRGVKDGLWVNTRNGWQPTALGRQYFTSANMLAMKLVKPLHRTVVSVTGIAEGAVTGNKLVEFTWRFTDLTRSLSNYTGATTGDHAGTAVFRQYDDGWRIIDLDCGSVRSGTNSRPFKEEKSATGFSYLGTFETNEEYGHHLFKLWRDGTSEVVGILLYPLMEADSPTAKIKKGSYDSATGKLSVTAIMNGTVEGFEGTFKAGVLKGVVTRRALDTGKTFETNQVTCTRRTDDDNDMRRFLSRAQWEAEYAQRMRFRPEGRSDE